VKTNASFRIHAILLHRSLVRTSWNEINVLFAALILFYFVADVRSADVLK